MPRRTVASCGVVLALALASCTPSHVDAVWPEPRPLDKSVPTYRPPVDPPVPLTAAEEPVGVVSLCEVLRLTLLRNPDLAVFALGVRAAAARTLQAGVFPNPEIGLTVEDFGGTGAGRGVRAAETTVQLSQLLELGGKRVKRFRLAGLEHDLAGWDLQSKSLPPSPNGSRQARSRRWRPPEPACLWRRRGYKPHVHKVPPRPHAHAWLPSGAAGPRRSQA